MKIGEVLGRVECAGQEELNAMALKIVRLYDSGKAGEVIVAGDANGSLGNGDFVMLLTRKEATAAFRSDILSVDYAIIGLVDDLISSYSSIRKEHNKEKGEGS